MPNEEQKKPTEQNAQPNSVSGKDIQKSYSTDEYIAAIKELKENTVPREDYEKLREDKRALTKALAEGRAIQLDIDTTKEVKLDELKKSILSSKDMTNLDYVSNALKLREKLIQNGKPDPFAPNSRTRATTEAELATANKVASILQKCVDDSNGDANLFNSFLQRRMR